MKAAIHSIPSEAKYKIVLARKRIERANAQIKELKEFIEANDSLINREFLNGD